MVTKARACCVQVLLVNNLVACCKFYRLVTSEHYFAKASKLGQGDAAKLPAKIR